VGILRPSEGTRLGFVGLGWAAGVLALGLTSRVAFEQRRAQRNLKGIVQETRCFLSG